MTSVVVAVTAQARSITVTMVPLENCPEAVNFSFIRDLIACERNLLLHD